MVAEAAVENRQAEGDGGQAENCEKEGSLMMYDVILGGFCR